MHGTFRRKFFRRAPLFLAAALLFVTLVTFAFTALWNWLMPSLFGLKAIGFWQALGLFVLSRLLFGFRGFHPRGGSLPWRRRMMGRWEQMTPEEREKLRAGMHDVFERCPRADSPAAKPST